MRCRVSDNLHRLTPRVKTSEAADLPGCEAATGASDLNVIAVMEL